MFHFSVKGARFFTSKGVLFITVIVHNDVKTGSIFFIFGNFCKIKRPQLWKHANDGGSIMGQIFNGISVQSQTVQVR